MLINIHSNIYFVSFDKLDFSRFWFKIRIMRISTKRIWVMLIKLRHWVSVDKLDFGPFPRNTTWHHMIVEQIDFYNFSFKYWHDVSVDLSFSCYRSNICISWVSENWILSLFGRILISSEYRKLFRSLLLWYWHHKNFDKLNFDNFSHKLWHHIFFAGFWLYFLKPFTFREIRQTAFRSV